MRRLTAPLQESNDKGMFKEEIMTLPIQVTFRNMDASPAVETVIREKAAKLEHLFSHITYFRVTVEQDHKHHHKGNLFRITVDIKVPNDELVVNRSPAEDHSHSDIMVAIRDAFDATKKQLDAYVDRLHRKVKKHG